MFAGQYPPFPQGQGQGNHILIIVRHYYDIWPLIHLISLGLWLVLFLLLVCGLICRICRKKMRMCGWRGYGCCQGRSHGPNHGCCQGRSHGPDHGNSGCRSHDHPVPPFHHLDAVEILRQRYASGEIDDATFEHMRERLGPSVGPERPFRRLVALFPFCLGITLPGCYYNVYILALINAAFFCKNSCEVVHLTKNLLPPTIITSLSSSIISDS